MNNLPLRYTDAEIIAARPDRNEVNPRRPYLFFNEPERAAHGAVKEISTIFLTNSECPFHCLYCDLWKNTTLQPVGPGAIPAQINYALTRLPPAQQVKLYNSGNFFDARAITISDHPAIAQQVNHFDTVIVENHPRLCTARCLRFRDLLTAKLEIALGLETVHPQILPLLNKQMSLSDFDRAVHFLVASGIAVRTFILLRPPLLNEAEGIDWALRSLEHAFSVGVECCCVIPTRAGNGIMEQLQRDGHFSPPCLKSLEQVLEAGLQMNAGRVFVDLWDAERLAGCLQCSPARIARLREMNFSQQLAPPVICDCESSR